MPEFRPARVRFQLGLDQASELVRYVVSIDYFRVIRLEQTHAFAQVRAVVGDDLPRHADAPGQTL